MNAEKTVPKIRPRALGAGAKRVQAMRGCRGRDAPRERADVQLQAELRPKVLPIVPPLENNLQQVARARAHCDLLWGGSLPHNRGEGGDEGGLLAHGAEREGAGVGVESQVAVDEGCERFGSLGRERALQARAEPLGHGRHHPALGVGADGERAPPANHERQPGDGIVRQAIVRSAQQGRGRSGGREPLFLGEIRLRGADKAGQESGIHSARQRSGGCSRVEQAPAGARSIAVRLSPHHLPVVCVLAPLEGALLA